jgi:hypothetical protein
MDEKERGVEERGTAFKGRTDRFARLRKEEERRRREKSETRPTETSRSKTAARARKEEEKEEARNVADEFLSRRPSDFKETMKNISEAFGAGNRPVRDGIPLVLKLILKLLTGFLLPF